MSDTLAIVILTAFGLFVLVLLALIVLENRRLRDRKRDLHDELDRLHGTLQQQVAHHCEVWKRHELEAIVQQQRQVALREAGAQLVEWKAQSIEQIRKEAILKSRSVTLGKVVEHIAPFFPVFPFNPRDARFLGSPVDFVVFDGASEGEIRRVVLLEIKSGTSTLNTKQRRIRDVVEQGRVEWHELRLAADGAA